MNHVYTPITAIKQIDAKYTRRFNQMHYRYDRGMYELKTSVALNMNNQGLMKLEMIVGDIC